MLGKMFKLYVTGMVSWGLSLSDMPAFKRLTYFWNGGSILGIRFMFQLLRGILLVLYYTPLIDLSFFFVDYISRESWWGFFFRVFHLNSASFIFFFLYFHLFRGANKGSFRIGELWIRGASLLILFMVVAFLGYVLPWGQISLWGATVICSFITTIPILGNKILFWVWGRFLLGRASLKFFFLLHFLLPFICLAIVLFHLVFLHEFGSTRVLFTHENLSKIYFSPYFWAKDLLFFVLFCLYFFFMFYYPWALGDPENWIFANPNMSPLHIQPEWYFLFAYAILRGVPNKLGGVLLLVLRVVGLYFLYYYSYYTSISYLLPYFCYYLMVSFLVLTWLGRCPVEPPYVVLRQVFSFLYFFFMFALPLLVL